MMKWRIPVNNHRGSGIIPDIDTLPVNENPIKFKDLFTNKKEEDASNESEFAKDTDLFFNSAKDTFYSLNPIKKKNSQSGAFDENSTLKLEQSLKLFDEQAYVYDVAGHCPLLKKRWNVAYFHNFDREERSTIRSLLIKNNKHHTFPYNLVGSVHSHDSLRVKRSGRIEYGSGILLNENYILTAAHPIFVLPPEAEKEENDPNYDEDKIENCRMGDSITFYPGLHAF